MCAIEYWYQGVVEGYVSKFAIESHQSLKKVLEFCKKGLCRRLMKEILAWIKMLMEEWEMLRNPMEIEA